METQTKQQNEERKLNGCLWTIAKMPIYYLAFEGAMRIAEANLPPQYAEVARGARGSIETLTKLGATMILLPTLGMTAIYRRHVN